MGFDLLSAQGHLLGLEVIEGYGLLSGKEVLGAPGALQRLGAISLIVVAAGVAQLRQALWVALARPNRLEAGHPGRPSDMTDHLGALAVHLFQGLLQRLDMVGCGGHEHLPVTQVAAQHAHLVSRSQGASEQAISCASVAATCNQADRLWADQGRAWLGGDQ